MFVVLVVVVVFVVVRVLATMSAALTVAMDEWRCLQEEFQQLQVRLSRHGRHQPLASADYIDVYNDVIIQNV